MKDRDERRDTSLPVTGEVGGEGGSYADAVVQVATEEGDVDRTDSAGDTELPRPTEDTSEGFIKYPDE